MYTYIYIYMYTYIYKSIYIRVTLEWCAPQKDRRKCMFIHAFICRNLYVYIYKYISTYIYVTVEWCAPRASRSSRRPGLRTDVGV